MFVSTHVPVEARVTVTLVFLLSGHTLLFLLCVCLKHVMRPWRSEDNLWKSVLASYHMHSGDYTQVIPLGNRYKGLLKKKKKI